MSNTSPRTETTKLDENSLDNVAGGIGATDAGLKQRANGSTSLCGTVNISNANAPLLGGEKSLRED